ncbi:MAG: hypothetical protein CSA20_09725 [Deltaproteobacteria bacterium]|nr:MAG: hypothetical protein CSA20_09725 [Deltaproteobacteria bacterium]
MNSKKQPCEEQLQEIFVAACAHHNDGDLPAARKLYTLLLKYVDSPLLRYNLGLISHEEKDYAEAMAQFKRGLAMQPEDQDMLFNLALASKACGEHGAAIEYYKNLLALAPDHIDALFNLAGCYRDLLDDKTAIKIYEKILTLKEDFAPAINNAAYCCQRAGKHNKALSYYRQIVKLRPDNEAAQHMIAALEGTTVNKAPEAYIRETFDDYAAHYETSLVDQLDYSVPEKLRAVIQSHPELPSHFTLAIDLGCGTGLSGAAFGDCVAEFHGIDLSEKMLEIAATKNIYKELMQTGIREYCSGTQHHYDLIIAADVFGYIGELEETFAQIRQKTLAEAVFCFSTERSNGAQLTLGATGRFAHHPSYIDQLARATGWAVLSKTATELRKEKGEWIKGDLWILRPM